MDVVEKKNNINSMLNKDFKQGKTTNTQDLIKEIDGWQTKSSLPILLKIS